MSFTLRGLYSAIGTVLLFAAIGLHLGGFEVIFREFPLFLSGHIDQVAAFDVVNLDAVSMFGVLAALLAIKAPICIGMAVIICACLGDKAYLEPPRIITQYLPDTFFARLFGVNYIEELIARWIPIGILAFGIFGRWAPTFYVLALAANAFWAWLHIFNYGRGQRSLWRVVPQFTGGLSLIYSFYKFGFLPTLVLHVSYNAIVYALEKEQKLDVVDLLITGVQGFLAGVSYFFLGKPLKDMTQWLSPAPNFPLPGWGFLDYLLASVFIVSLTNFIFSVLVYDYLPPGTRNAEGKWVSNRAKIGCLGLIILPWFINGMLKWWFGSFFLGVFALAILYCFQVRQTEGSSLSRTFFVSVPAMYITLCLVGALGFWSFIGYLAVLWVIMAPEKLLLLAND